MQNSNQLGNSSQLISGHKRNYNDNTSDTTSTTTSYNLSPETTNNTTTTNTNFASHLPPLHKKAKLMTMSSNMKMSANVSNINIDNINLNLPSFNVPTKQIFSPVARDNILPHAIICDKLFMNNNLNNNTTNNNTIFNLDNLIKAIGNLPSINTYQMNILSQLILATDTSKQSQHLILPNINSQPAPQRQRQQRQMHTQTVNNTKKIVSISANRPTNNRMKLIKNAQKTNKNKKQKKKYKYEYKLNPNANGNENVIEQGQSCHQCKTKKDVKILFYCTKKRLCNTGGNSNSNNHRNNSKKKKCRKKYCKACMSKYYQENDIKNLNEIKDCENIWKWECPSCKGVCSCRACKRKRMQ